MITLIVKRLLNVINSTENSAVFHSSIKQFSLILDHCFGFTTLNKPQSDFSATIHVEWQLCTH